MLETHGSNYSFPPSCRVQDLTHGRDLHHANRKSLNGIFGKRRMWMESVQRISIETCGGLTKSPSNDIEHVQKCNTMDDTCHLVFDFWSNADVCR